MGSFEFTGNVSKAWEEGGHKYITVSNVTDTRKDGDGERMAAGVLAQLCEIAKTGKQPDGTTHRPILIDGHKTSFELGESVDAHVFKSADGEYVMNQDFRLNPDHPLSDMLFNDVAKGTCNKQASIHGKMLAKMENGPDGKPELVWKQVGQFDHVAVTRAGAAAVSKSGFMNAVYKSLSKDDLEGDNDMENAELKSMIEGLAQTVSALVEKEKKNAPAAPTVESLTAELETVTKELNALKAGNTNQMSDVSKAIGESEYGKTISKEISDIKDAVTGLSTVTKGLVEAMSRAQNRQSVAFLAPGSSVVTRIQEVNKEKNENKSESDIVLAEYEAVSKEIGDLSDKRDAGELDSAGKIKLQRLADQRLSLHSQLANQFHMNVK